MSGKLRAPYGSWKSPITSDLIVAGSVGLSEPVISGNDIYWLEMRPKEAGRYVVVKRSPDGKTCDVTPAPLNARTRVHEYGGGAVLIDDDTVYFTNFADQRLYRVHNDDAPEPLSPAADIRFADFVVDRAHSRLITVCEDHTVPGPYPENTISAIAMTGGAPTVLARGHDFFSTPRISPDGSRLAYLSWDHPDMPWDSTSLHVADIAPDGSLANDAVVAGGGKESIYQPEWSPDGVLHFVSDRTGWWNIYALCEGGVVPLCPMNAEFARPQWVFGRPTYAFESSSRILCTYTQDGVWSLARLDTATGRLKHIETSYTDISSVRVYGSQAVLLAAGPAEYASVVLVDLASLSLSVLRRAADVDIDEGFISAPEPVHFPTENGLTSHALLYRPKNRDFSAPDGELPPLLVHIHGGPTGAAGSGLSLSTQYWTSRGFAVVDVNYGGSTGYGRPYRERLEGNWGVVDVDDCCHVASYLVTHGVVDPRRLAIAGGSAGGYTTLCALTFRDVFEAGASHFGVSDAEALATDTHKFESRYLDRLIGPYPADRAVYIDRSPVHFVDDISCPVIFFQGLEDKIVPPDQAERMVNALKAKGLPVAYVAFEGEQHGFRQAAHIKRALDGEFYFYSRVFGFKPADEIEPVEIFNLD